MQQNNEPLKFKVGQFVDFINDYGIRFYNYRITALCNEDHDLYKYGCRYFLNWESYWMPVKESNLLLVENDPIYKIIHGKSFNLESTEFEDFWEVSDIANTKCIRYFPTKREAQDYISFVLNRRVIK